MITALDRRGIIESIRGPARQGRLFDQYRLFIEDNLPEVIADDLLRNPDAASALAPTLQVLLTNMWKRATKTKSDERRFDRSLYESLKDEGYLLKAILDEGLKAVGLWDHELESSGLALDVLEYHTTDMGVVGQHDRSDLDRRYPHKAGVLGGLLGRLEDHYLLVKAETPAGAPGHSIRLAHDLLAPLVQQRFRTSVAPGQHARRLLENRAPQWRDGKTGHVLDTTDLASVEAGAPGMRGWTPDEIRLVEASRHIEHQRKAEELSRKRLLRNFVYALAGAFALSVGASIYAWVQRGEAKANEAESEKQAKIARKEKDEARKQTKIARRQTAEVLTAAGVTALEQGSSLLAMHQFAAAIKAVDQDTMAQEDNRLRLGMVVRVVPVLRAIVTGTNAALSPDGMRVVTAYDKTARVWETESGKLVATLYGHFYVNSATFSPDGKRVVTTSYDKTARVLEVDSGKTIATFQEHAASVNSAKFSPNGKRVVTASDDSTARVWAADSGEIIATFKEHTGPVYSATFSPDGKRIVTASWDRTARVWEADSGRPVATLQGHNWAVYSAAFSPDGKRVVTASDDNTVRVWAADSGKNIATVKAHFGRRTSPAFSPDGMRVVTASSNLTAQVWGADSGRTIATLQGHTAQVNSAAFSPDGKRIVTASDDKTARVWNPDSGKPLATFEGHARSVRSAAFCPNGKRVVTTDDNTARVWDAGSGKTFAIFQGHKAERSTPPRSVPTASGSSPHHGTRWRGSGTPTPARPSPPSPGTSKLSTPPGSAPTARGSSPHHSTPRRGSGTPAPARPSPRSGTPHLSTPPRSAPTARGSSPPLATRRRGSGTPTPASTIATLHGHTRHGHLGRVQPRRQAGRHRLERQDGAGLGRRLRQARRHAQGHNALVNSAAFSPDGKRVVTAS